MIKLQVHGAKHSDSSTEMLQYISQAKQFAETDSYSHQAWHCSVKLFIKERHCILNHVRLINSHLAILRGFSCIPFLSIDLSVAPLRPERDETLLWLFSRLSDALTTEDASRDSAFVM